jgi:hypothetical protein
MKENTIFKINTNPVYCVEISKSQLLSSFNTTSDGEIFAVMDLIKSAFNATKPENINDMEVSRPISKYDWDNPKLYLSGKDMNEELMTKINDLLVEMIVLYNAENFSPSDYDSELLFDIDSYGFYLREKEVKERFLKSVAEAYWLDLELGSSSEGTRKVNKL